MNSLLNVGDVNLAWHAHIFGHEERIADRFGSKDGSDAASNCWPAQRRRLAKSGGRIYVMRKTLEFRDLAEASLIRRECLDHAIVLNERHLRRILASYLDDYHRSRCHLSLDKDAPHGRPVQPVGSGETVAIPQIGGLHHRYERLAA